jgi:hypothetical protein
VHTRVECRDSVANVRMNDSGVSCTGYSSNTRTDTAVPFTRHPTGVNSSERVATPPPVPPSMTMRPPAKTHRVA